MMPQRMLEPWRPSQLAFTRLTSHTQDVRGHLSQGGKACSYPYFLTELCCEGGYLQGGVFPHGVRQGQLLKFSFQFQARSLDFALCQETLQPKGYGFCDFADLVCAVKLWLLHTAGLQMGFLLPGPGHGHQCN